MSDDQRIYDKLDKMDQRLDNVDQTLVKNTVLLDEHIRRTNILEEDFKPIKKHVALMNALAKIGSVGLGALLAAKQLGLF